MKKSPNFATAKGKVALVSTIQLAEMEDFRPFQGGFLRVPLCACKNENEKVIYTLLI
jgi:hypothetical protein